MLYSTSTVKYFRGKVSTRILITFLLPVTFIVFANFPIVASASGFDEVKKDARQGNADAQSRLGDMYSIGDGVPQDTVEAVRWYRMAAEQGDAMAQIKLGFMYDGG